MILMMDQAVLLKAQQRVLVEARVQVNHPEVTMEVHPVVETHLEAEVHQAAMDRATAIPVVETILAEAIRKAVPATEVIREPAPEAENLPAVKAQNNV